MIFPDIKVSLPLKILKTSFTGQNFLYLGTKYMKSSFSMTIVNRMMLPTLLADLILTTIYVGFRVLLLILLSVTGMVKFLKLQNPNYLFNPH